jgi:hypothetical protein
MNAMVDASISPLAAAPTGDRFAAPLARIAAKLRSHGLGDRKSPAATRATQEAYLVRADLVVARDSTEGAADVVEPSMEELLERLAALREDIRRARQRYFNDVPGLGQSAAEASARNGERGRA